MFHVVVVLVFPCTCSWAESIKFVENHWHLHHHMMLRFLTFTCLFNLISDRRMVHAQECKLSFKNGMSRNTGNNKTHHQGMCKSKMKELLNLAIWRVGKTPCRFSFRKGPKFEHTINFTLRVYAQPPNEQLECIW